MKVHNDSPELHGLLEKALDDWNTAVAGTVAVLIDMRSGRLGPTGADFWNYCKDKVQDDPLTWLTRPLTEPSPSTNMLKHELSVAYRHAHRNSQAHTAEGGHEALTAIRDAIPNSVWGQMHRRSIEFIKSYEELHKLWEKEHAEWLIEKATWEDEHPHYMRVRPHVEAFQRERGAARGSRIRWAAWCDFLLSTPAIAAWATPGTEAIPPTEAQLGEIAASKPKKKVARAQRDLVFGLNPELAAFDRVHGAYERDFARTYAKRRHHDGFRHRPSFTLPALPAHPDWPRFKGGEGWQKLDLEARTIELALKEGRTKWTRIPFVADRRLRALSKAEQPIKIRRTNYHYEWRSPSGDIVPAQPQGLKLVQRDGAWHLLVSFDIAPPPCAIEIEQKAAGKYAVSWQQKKLTEQEWTSELPLVTCAVDLGIRDLGAASIALSVLDPESKQWTISLVARRILHNRFFLDEGRSRAINIPSLPEIARVQRRLRSMRRATGRMAPAKVSCARMAAHYRNMQDDRTKKGVAAILFYARHHGASGVVFENLTMLNPDAANERGVNAALSRWNRGAIVAFAEQAAEGYGLRVFKVPSYFTSRICSACGKMGTRFDRGASKWRVKRSKELDGQSPDALRNVPRLHHLGHWFVCPNCARQVHADINASENLHRVLLGVFPAVKTVEKRDGRSWAWEVDTARVDRDSIEAGAKRVLGLDSAGHPLLDTPF